ncbi:MAG: response regulator transcription factor [Anaerolineales bacterium]|nr:response regulator transcription factor [Anaerolineales bacterium]MCX7756505.1 response regulator transcription factor [Anaerolineales bacterium]MDW8278646.1 response regulator transcription factor [Anaerolineales bacterium]
MPELILVVEDEPTLQETLAYNLEKQGYRVETAGDGRSALETARRLKPDLIVLDIMLPALDGIEVCKTLRRESFTSPILMLTARDEEIDRVVGLEIGADDYLTKPFSMRELLARIKAQLRRTQVVREELDKLKTSAPAQDTLIFGNLAINRTRREVTLDDAVIPLKPQEYELLLFFAEHRGQMLSREFILERVWGWDYIGDSRTVDVHVRWLRQKIEADPANPARIVTVRGGGYRFEG